MSEHIAAHPECQQAVSGLRLDHKLLEKDVHQLSIMGDRLTDAVNKIQEMNSNLCALIKIHTEKHEHHSETAKALDEDFNHLAEKFNQLHNYVNEPIEDSDEYKSIKKTVAELERWKWMIIGGAIALGFVFGHLSFDFLSKLLH